MRNIARHLRPGERDAKNKKIDTQSIFSVEPVKQIYVALKDVGASVPRGRIVFNTHDWRFNRGMKLADDWALPEHSRAWLDSVTLENEPLAGFKIQVMNDRQVSRNYETASFATIADPRGFDVEVSFAALGELLQRAVVDKGKILGACVWNAEDDDLCLMPVA